MRHVERVMGRGISIELADALPGRSLYRLIASTSAWLREVDAKFSIDRPDSEISRLRRRNITVEDCSANVRKVLDACARLWDRTDGYFDAYASGELDPSDYVRGWAVEVASARLTEAGSTNHCLRLPGLVRMRGRPAPDRLWRVGVYPLSTDRPSWVLGGTNLAVATVGADDPEVADGSGGTDGSGWPSIDPLSGEGVGPLRSVTVAGPDLRLAVAYATAARTMGAPGLRWLAKLAEFGYESAAVSEQGKAYRSKGLPVQPFEWNLTAC
jgi:thiamine biosynthesis lipoprotein